MDVIILCHTEFGFVYDKQVITDKKAIKGVKEGVSNLLKISNKYGAKVTFAVMPEVIQYFPKNVNHEIGLHIHPGWVEFNQKGFKFYVGDFYLKELIRAEDALVYFEKSLEVENNQSAIKDMIRSLKEDYLNKLNPVWD